MAFDGSARVRPGLLRRAAAGAFHVPSGFVFLAKHPRLLPLAAVPALAAGVCVLGSLAAAVYAGPSIESALTPSLGGLSTAAGVLVAVTIWIAILTTALALGLGLALLVAAPLLEQLSLATEIAATGASSSPSRGAGWELAESLRSALYFLAAAPFVFLIGLVPVVGPFLGALWAARALAFQLSEAPLLRRGLGFNERRAWHREWRPESLGFGLLALAVLLIPCASFLLAPVLVVGATRLVLELPGATPGAAVEPEAP